ncbi:hypothetical protein SELMODRAFT_407992 [Selaginella moellendorffii]|uniref:Uncharacterized protein n=1 Tax=Selaginella moellendorffii TaxID=88036 RepID=D8R6V1_SELML|nr:hypothetical protein SELMODRAFT_407992 [Selaginella moellendorffii]
MAKSSIAFILPLGCLLLVSVVHVSALDSDVSGDLSVIIILEIIVIYIPGGFPCPLIIGVICKYLRNAIPVWTPIKFIKVDLTVILSLTTTIKLLQSVIILVTPNSCIFLVLSALVNILKSVLALLY